MLFFLGKKHQQFKSVVSRKVMKTTPFTEKNLPCCNIFLSSDKILKTNMKTNRDLRFLQNTLLWCVSSSYPWYIVNFVQHFTTCVTNHTQVYRHIYKTDLEKVVGHLSIPQVTIYYYKAIIDWYLSWDLKNSTFLFGKTYIYYLNWY